MSLGHLVELDTGQLYALGFEPTTIGRHEEGNIILADAQVSRHHAEVVMQGGKWAIRDLGSANGTFVNGQRIGETHVLAPNDIIEVGRTRFRFEMEAPIGDQDTLIEKLPVVAAPPARSGISWLVVVLALIALLAVILVGVLVVLPEIQEPDEVAQGPTPTENAPPAGQATVVEPDTEPAASAVPAKPTATAIPTIAPPTEAPSPLPPTKAPTDTPVPEPGIGLFRADQTTIEEGTCTRLAWGEIENAGSITLSGVGPVGASGKMDVCPAATKTYTLAAAGAGGSVEKSVQITVQPPAGPVIEYLRTVPSIISPGECAQLEWGKVDNATSAAIEPGIGGVGTPGNQKVCPGSTTAYILTAQDPSGTSTAETTLIVSAGTDPKPVIAFFTADPASIQAGECTTLSWGKVDYASAVTIDNSIAGVATPGSKEVCLGKTATFVITALGAGGITTNELTVTVSPGQQAELPNLVIESILFEPNPCYKGQTCKVRLKVRNDGPVAAEHHIVRWAPEGEGEVPVEWDVDMLGADQEMTLSYNWLPNRTNDNWLTVATVDAYDEIQEIVEGAGNILEQHVTVLER